MADQRSYWQPWKTTANENYLYAFFPTTGRETVPTTTLNNIPNMTKEQALQRIQQEEAFIPLDPSTVYTVVIHSTTTTDLNALDQEWSEKTTPGGSGQYKHMPFAFVVNSLGVASDGRSTDIQPGFKDPAWSHLNNDLHICYCASDPEPHDADSAVLSVVRKIVDWRFEGDFSKIRYDQIYIHAHNPAHKQPGCGNAFGICAQRAASRWRLIHQYSSAVPEVLDGTYEQILSAMVQDEAHKRGYSWGDVPVQTTPTPGPSIPNPIPQVPVFPIF